MGAAKGNKNALGNKGGQPTKLTSLFIETAEDVLKDGALMLFTDAELLDEINENLPIKNRICQRTFYNWKEKFKAKKYDEIEPIGLEFLHLLKKTVRYQKKMLLNALVVDHKSWHRWAWLAERKWDEFNIRRKTDIKADLQIEQPKHEVLSLKDLRK